MNRRYTRPQTPPPSADADLESLLERSVVEAGGQVPPAPAAEPLARPSADLEPLDAPAMGAVRYSSGQLGDLFDALAAAQSEMGHAAKNADNPFFESRYADLAAVIDAARAPLTKHGIAVIQMPSVRNGRAVVTTRFGHKSGQWMESELELTPRNPKPKFNGRGESYGGAEATTPQAFGSAFSHARRYAYSAMAGLAQMDDDGNMASGHEDTRQQAEPAPAPRAAYRENARAFDRRMSGAAAEAQNIDTGGAEPGTREAAANVADRKIAALRQRRTPPPASTPAPAAAPKPPVPDMGTNTTEIRRAFQAIRDVLGDKRYFAELNAAAGVRDATEFKSLSVARAAYKTLLAVVHQEVA